MGYYSAECRLVIGILKLYLSLRNVDLEII